MRTVINPSTSCIHDVDMEYPNYSGIQVRMVILVLVLGQHYDVTVRSMRVDGVLFPANIICGIVDTKNIMHIELIVLE